jgi:DNA polymerase epsilon subunit 2|tara:strand:- start:300 stop:953 length:654 start_codon:yes stop_codon:yes gene_type:complete
MGNFTSLPISHAKDGVKTAIDNFDALGNMIAEDFPRIARKAKFIFIPGNHDPGGGEVYPRPPLPRIFTRVLESKIQHFNAASNPCRLRFFSQEIVFFREDLVNKLQRNCIVPPEEVEGGDGGGGGGSSEIPKNAVKTLLDQGHLCPLPIGTNPVYWEYDHALRLYPPPDALVVGDSVAQHVLSYDGCTAMNPGSFVQDWNFVVYRPTDGETEFSSLA